MLSLVPDLPAQRTPGCVELTADPTSSIHTLVRIDGVVVATLVYDRARGTYQAMSSGMCLTGQVDREAARAEVVACWRARLI